MKEVFFGKNYKIKHNGKDIYGKLIGFTEDKKVILRCRNDYDVLYCYMSLKNFVKESELCDDKRVVPDTITLEGGW